MLLAYCFLLALCTTYGVSTPTITSEPEEVKVAVGDRAKLTCTVSNIESSPVFWSHNGGLLAMSRHVVDPERVLTVEGVDGYSYNLHFENVQLFDEGNYTCQIAGTQPPVVMLSKLIVNVRPVITNFTPDAKTLVLDERDRLQLSCSATGKPQPTISWTRRRQNDQPRRELNGFFDDDEEEDAVPLSDYETLIVQSVRQYDHGTYVCSASNEAGTARKEIQVTVQFMPIVEIGNEVDVIRGQNVELRCVFRANPVPTVEWEHNDEYIDLNVRRNIAFNEIPAQLNETNLFVSTLTINGVDDKDIGLYRCNVKNAAGSGYAEFTVIGLPRPPEIASDTRSEYCDQYTLQWTVQSASPVLSYQLEYWEEFPRRSENATRINVTMDWDPKEISSYVINGLEPRTTYNGRLTATNEFGTSESSEIFEFLTEQEGMTAPQSTQMTTSKLNAAGTTTFPIRDGWKRSPVVADSGATPIVAVHRGMLYIVNILLAVFVHRIAVGNAWRQLL